MAAYSSQYYSSGVPIPSKDADTSYTYPYGYNNPSYSVSPPETTDPSVLSSGGGTYSYGGSSNAAAIPSGAPAVGAAGDYYYGGGESTVSASGVDFNEYMQERFADAFDPLPLDRSLVTQAQTSGTLNAKHRELLELQAKAQARLAKSRARFADGVRDAQEVRANLEWTSKKVSSMKKKAEKKHSKEYQKARERYPSPDY
ncbi:putative biogenesis of lysosome-related organelles complex 1 subunit KXD1 [Rosellinia necatrix]|uniref:Biogenesis of lysosome-related organelles complex 1 subunit KXD1 n=1 Tax=Rosellinia necatrix TaxID=77044 RepID=A0A1W2TIC2_ROSNE|nr:putative biogenesis of lysosome-related organelles complex 1 subunit KXD1 [Rosellinia necatrix]